VFFWPGRKVIVSLTDGTVITAVTRLSVRALRLGSVEYPHPSGSGSVEARGSVVVPVHAVLTVQVVG
jgi:hypothetical protein